MGWIQKFDFTSHLYRGADQDIFQYKSLVSRCGSRNEAQDSLWSSWVFQHNRTCKLIPLRDFIGYEDTPLFISDTVGNSTESTTVDGINLDEIKEFAKQFKIRRLSLGLTQTQVGQALSATEGPAYSQSAICR